MQRRLFTLASAMFIISGFLHFYGQFSPNNDAAYITLLQQMSAYKFTLGTVEATLVDVMQCWGAYFGFLMLVIGSQNLLLVLNQKGSENDTLLLHRFTVFSVIISALLVAIGMRYNAIFPVFFYSVTTLILIVAVVVEEGHSSIKDAIKTIRLMAAWCAAAYLAWMMIEMGVVKFDDAGFWTPAFERWGYPQWLRILVGLLEIIGGAMILIPWCASLGAGLLTSVMIGAWVTRWHDGRMKDIYWLSAYILCLLWIGFEWWKYTGIKRFRK